MSDTQPEMTPSSPAEPGEEPADDSKVVLGPVISSTPIEEHVPAGSRLTPPSTAEVPDREKTRTWIAWTMVGALVGLALVGAVGWLVNGDDIKRMQSFAIVFSPIVTLVGTILGFYFSSSKSD